MRAKKRRQLLLEPLESRHLLDAALVKDLDPVSPSSRPQDLTVVGDLVYFAARSTTADGPHTLNQLWVSDGREQGTREVAAAFDFSRIDNLVGSHDTLYFTTHFGRKLWTTDGTSNGTVLIREWPSDGSRFVESVAVADHGLFFTLHQSNRRRTEVWKSDGTAEGTHHVINVRSIVRAPRWSEELVTVGDRAYLIEQRSNQHLLHVIDRDDVPRSVLEVESISSLVPFGDQLAAVTSGTGGWDLQLVEGLEDNSIQTRIVSRAREAIVHPVVVEDAFYYFRQTGPTSGNSATLFRYDVAHDVTELTTLHGRITAVAALRDKLYFGITRGDDHHELWQSDGSSNGTKLVTRLPNAVLLLRNLGPWLLIRQPGAQLLSDGTSEGTQLLTDRFPSSDLMRIEPNKALAWANDQIFFSAYDQDSDEELWVARDGASQRVRDIYAEGSRTSNPRQLTTVADKVFFTSADQFWVSDLTTDGTQNISLPDGAPQELDILGTTDRGVFFSTYVDGEQSIWVSDGTETGTQQVSPSLGPRIFDYDVFYHPLLDAVGFGGQLFFTTNKTLPFEPELWVSDGTSKGTRPFVVPELGNFISMEVQDGKLYFLSGKDVWQSDGSVDGTQKVLSLEHDIRKIQVVGNRLYAMEAVQNYHLSRLWVTDLNLAKPARRLLETPITAHTFNLSRVGDQLAFASWSAAEKNELWISDGTPEGTGVVADLRPGSKDAHVKFMDSVGGYLLFVTNDGEHGLELWRTDGTTEGTQLLADTNPGAAHGLHISQTTVPTKRFARIGASLFFFDNHPDRPKLWKTDGTRNGTEPLATPFRSIQELSMLDSQLIMFADDGRLGTEFWTFSLNTGKELAGDANRDGKVNFSDLLVLAENFGRTDAQWEEGDFDGNTTVDFADFLLLAAGFPS